MNGVEIMYAGKEVGHKKSSSVKTSEALTKEKGQLQEKNAAKNDLIFPAPYYDELHFANYE